MREQAVRWINWVRDQELEALRPWLEPLARRRAPVLEIGGGNGFLAARLAALGLRVTSIDPRPRQPGFFPVRVGDATRLDFPDAGFDLIFSSNVLEHIDDLPAALAEMKRVLRLGGLMIHTMPTPTNTVLTILTQPAGHYFELAFLFGAARQLLQSHWRGGPSPGGPPGPEPSTPAPNRRLSRRHARQALQKLNPLRLLLPARHGVSPHCWTELRDWREAAWRRRFAQAGLTVEAVAPLPLAYSRNVCCPFRLVGLRRRLARTGWTSSRGYLLRIPHTQGTDLAPKPGL